MLLYIGLIAVLLVYSLVAVDEQSQKVGCCLSIKRLDIKAYHYKKLCNVLAGAMLIFLWFLTAFRAANIGNDTKTYINYFIKINSTGASSQYVVEYGFQYLCLLIGLFTEDPQVFLIVCATICYLGVGIYIFKYSKNIIVSAILVFCLCFSIFVNTLRQDIAMVFCLFAYQSIKDRKNIKALLLILFAFLFHKTAIIFLALFFNNLLKYNLKVDLVIAIVIILLSISGVLRSIALLVANKYAGYFNSKYSGTGWLAVSFEIARNVVFYIFIHKAYRKNLKSKKVILANFLLLLFLSCFGFIVNLFTRASQYFLLPAIIELPNACYKGNVRHKNIWLSAICIVLLLYFMVVLIFRPEWNNLYPYIFYWN